MHHPRSISAARRLRIAGVLLLVSRLLAMVAVGLLLVCGRRCEWRMKRAV